MALATVPLRAAAPRSRRAAARAPAARFEVASGEPKRLGNGMSEGLALSAAALGASFTSREDVAVTRSEEAGRTTVTIKVRPGAWSLVEPLAGGGLVAKAATAALL